VTVEDTTPPELRVPADLEREATSRRGAVVDYSAGASDRVSGPLEAECKPASGATFPIATTTVTCSARDAAGRVAVRSFSVRVFDAPPALRLPRDVTASAVDSSGARVTYPAATAADRVDGTLAAACTPASGSRFPLKSTEVKCTAKDSAGNVVTGTFRVTVADTTAPVITVPARPVTAEATTALAYTRIVSAADAVDGAVPVTCTPPSGSVVALGKQGVVCTAADAAGNAASASFTIIGRDTTPPVLKVPRSWSGPAGTPVPSAAIPVTASDTVDDAVTPTCAPASVPRGTSKITCTATDRAGNVGSATFAATGTVRG
jgi:hypothetical protein